MTEATPLGYSSAVPASSITIFFLGSQTHEGQESGTTNFKYTDCPKMTEWEWGFDKFGWNKRGSKNIFKHLVRTKLSTNITTVYLGAKDPAFVEMFPSINPLTINHQLNQTSFISLSTRFPDLDPLKALYQW